MENINQTNPQPSLSIPKNVFKYLFFIFFILFLIVTGILIIILITNNQKKISFETLQNTKTISKSPINSKIYKNSNYKITFNYPLDWEENTTAKEGVPEWLIGGNQIYKKSTTQDYPDENFPLDGLIILGKIDNPKNLTIDQIFEQDYQECNRNLDKEDPGMGCGKTVAVSRWESYTVDNVEGFRAKIQAPESIETDEIYFQFDKYYLVLTAIPYNQNYKNELEDIFTELIQSIKFNI